MAFGDRNARPTRQAQAARSFSLGLHKLERTVLELKGRRHDERDGRELLRTLGEL